jgi:hypothetical protein
MRVYRPMSFCRCKYAAREDTLARHCLALIIFGNAFILSRHMGAEKALACNE